MEEYRYEFRGRKYSTIETEIFWDKTKVGADEQKYAYYNIEWKWWTGILISDHKLTEEEIKTIESNQYQEWSDYEWEFADSSDGHEEWVFENEEMERVWVEEFEEDSYRSWEMRDYLEEHGWINDDYDVRIDGPIELIYDGWVGDLTEGEE